MIRFDLMALLFSMLLSSLGTSVINIALPSLIQSFHTSLQNAQWLVLAYLLSNSMFIVIVGKTSDRVNKKNLYLAGLGLFAISSFLAVFASDLWVLTLLRALQGLGSAILMSLSVVLLSELAKKEELPKYMGLIGTMSAVGTAAGPSAGGFLISLYGWESIFLLMSALGLANFILFLKFFKGQETRTYDVTEKFDVRGSLFFGVAVLLFILIINRAKVLETKSLILLGTALIAIVASFLQIEKRIKNPLIDFGLLNRHHMKSHLILNFTTSMVVMTTLVVGPFFLSQVQNLKYSDIGLVMAISPLVSILSGYLAGATIQRIGAERTLRSGLVIMFFGTVAYTFLPIHLGTTGYVLAAVILSPGYQLFQAANNTTLMTRSPIEQRGLVSSLNNLSRNLGLLTGASLMGAVFIFGVGAPDITAASSSDILNGTELSFAVAVLLSIISLGILFNYFGSFLAKPSKRVFKPNSNSVTKPGCGRTVASPPLPDTKLIISKICGNS